MAQLVDIPSPDWPLTFGNAQDPGVVLVHDRYGRLPYLEAYATALSTQGFFVVVPDLFHGRAAVDADGVAVLLGEFDDGFALATVEDALALARGGSDPDDSEPTRVGLIGMGLGGWLALRLAQRGEVDAVVAYYAGLSADEAGILPCPVLLHYAENGDWGADSEADGFVSRLKELGTPVTLHSYLATREGFANATIVTELDKNAAALAYARSCHFLLKHIAD